MERAVHKSISRHSLAWNALLDSFCIIIIVIVFL
jgi:hypothetical protein